MKSLCECVWGGGGGCREPPSLDPPLMVHENEIVNESLYWKFTGPIGNAAAITNLNKNHTNKLEVCDGENLW